MKSRYLYFYFIVCCLGLNGFTQIDEEKFLNDFYSSNVKGKVNLVAGVEFDQIKNIYPKIKDSLEKIKVKVYTNSSSKEGKFLFDKIEVSRLMYEKKFSKAAIILENSLSVHVRDIHDSLYCYMKLKELFINLSDLNKAIETNTLFDKLAIRTNEKRYTNYITKKSRIYDAFGLNQQAIIEKRKEYANEIKLKLNDTDYIASYYNDQGVYFNRLKKSDSALHYFKRADEYITKKLSYTSNKPHYQFFKGLIEGNMALAYANNGDYKKAIPFLKTDIYYSKRVNDLESAFNSCILLSRCFIKLNQLLPAQNYADSALAICNTLTQPRVKLKLLFLQGEMYDALGNAPQALLNYKAYLQLKDSVTDKEKELQLINQQVALDIKNQDLELAQKNQLIQNAEIAAEKSKVYRTYLLAGLIILIIIIAFLFYLNKNSKRREYDLEAKNEKIVFQNKQIEHALKEKELLLKEIHHRIKNNLQIISSVINLQADKIQEEKLKEILSELKLRISSIALTHQMLYQKGTTNQVLLHEYLQNLITQIYNSYENQKIKVSFEGNNKDCSIGIDTAIPLGLLVNEITTNAFKHAFKGKESGVIKITANVYGNAIELIIKDNGISLPKNYKDQITNPTTLGFELISILTQQLNVKMDVVSEGGTQYTLKLSA